METSKPIVIVEYEGKNITEDISRFLIDFSYTDNVHGKADEIQINLDDSQGLFQNDWYPDKKSKITAKIIHEGRTLPCGTFYIGTVDFGFPPDQISWHCTSINPGSKLRTKKSKSYNQLTLLQIARDIASNHNLQVDDGTKTITYQNPSTEEEQAKLVRLAELFLKHSNEPDNVFFYYQMSALQNQLLLVIQSLEGKGYGDQAGELRNAVGENLVDRSKLEATENDTQNAARKTRLGASKLSEIITNVKTELRLSPSTRTQTLGLGLGNIIIENSVQNCETDLAYLKRISAMYGLAFNIKPPYMVFYSSFHLNDTPAAVIIDKSSVMSGSLNDNIHDTYSDVDVKGHNPHENTTVNNTEEARDEYAGGQSENVLTVRTKVENKEQADAIGKAALYDKNSKTRTGNLQVPGNLLLVAGNNFELTGFGKFNQKYNIISSTHSISNSGEYTTAIDFKAGPVVVKISKKGKVTVK